MNVCFPDFVIRFLKMGDQLSPAMLAQIEALWTMKEAKQKEEMKEYIAMSRKASIEIKKREFHRPEDKRAVGFICDVNYDLEDFFAKTKEMLTNVGANDGNEPQVIDVAANPEKVTEFIKYCVGYGDKLSKKYNREFESYQVANSSRGGWKTVDFFHQSDLFDKSLNEKSWLDREDEGSEEKAKRLRNAERQAALDQREKAKFSENYPQTGSRRKRTRFDDFSEVPAVPTGPSASAVPAMSAAASPSYSPMMFGPSQMYYPPGAAQVQCYGCWGFGHMKKNCPQTKK